MLIPARPIRLLLPVCLVTLPGCASIFGTLSNQDYSELSDSDDMSTTALDPEVDVTATATTSATSSGESEFDVYRPPAESRQLLAPIGDVELTVPDAELSPNPFTVDSDAGSTQNNPSENPFAVMERNGSLQTVSHNRTLPGSTPASTFHIAEPRLPSPQVDCPPSDFVVSESYHHDEAAYPDEFIFDGGDRDYPVHYEGSDIAGLETEDTIVEFTDHHGEDHIEASNRVAVYAPRFGSVRTISGPGIGTKIDHAIGGTDISGIGSLHESQGQVAAIANVPATGIATRESAGGMQTAQPAFQSQKADVAMVNRKFDQGLESRTNTGLGKLEVSSTQELHLQILEPASSSRQTGYGQESSSSQATVAYSTFRLQSTVGLEEGGEKGEIHLTKSASPMVARAGDTITFTIHFRNTGDYPVHDVRIIDNLTPRLIYIQGTGKIATSNRTGGGLAVVPNKEGSELLEFTLDEPLPGGQSGTISFQARVL